MDGHNGPLAFLVVQRGVPFFGENVCFWYSFFVVAKGNKGTRFTHFGCQPTTQQTHVETYANGPPAQNSLKTLFDAIEAYFLRFPRQPLTLATPRSRRSVPIPSLQNGLA